MSEGLTRLDEVHASLSIIYSRQFQIVLYVRIVVV